MKVTNLALATLALVSVATPSAATLIVDTGYPPRSFTGGYGFDATQWYAAKFSSPAATLTGIAGYIGTISSGSFHIALYTAPGNTPGVELFNAVAVSTPAFSKLSFQGAEGLDWNIAAGDYFVSFEVRPEDTFRGFFTIPAAAPLAVEAIYQSWSGWRPIALSMGLRIGENAPVVGQVPEPASWLMLIAGFGLVGAVLRRRTRHVALLTS